MENNTSSLLTVYSARRSPYFTHTLCSKHYVQHLWLIN